MGSLVQQKTGDKKSKLALDEAAFQKLLSAAYIIQEHNDKQSPAVSSLGPKDFGAIAISELTDTRNLIRSRHLNLLEAGALVADRTQSLTNADGVAVAFLTDGKLNYTAADGIATSQTGLSVFADQSFSAECIRQKRTVQLTETQVNTALLKLFREREIQSLASIPILHERNVLGVVELHFSKERTLPSDQLQRCEQLTGLLAELIFPSAEPLTPSAEPPSEPAVKHKIAAPEFTQKIPASSMLSALNKDLSSEDQEMIEELAASFGKNPLSFSSAFSPEGSLPAELERHLATPAHPRGQESLHERVQCTCGNLIDIGESFCGICGAARASVTKSHVQTEWSTILDSPSEPEPVKRREEDSSPDLTIQKELRAAASLEPLPPELQEILTKYSGDDAPSAPEAPQSEPFLPKTDPPTALAPLTVSPEVAKEPQRADADKEANKDKQLPDNSENIVPTVVTVPSPVEIQTQHWQSANRARVWLESLKSKSPAGKTWIAEHRANIYLATSAILLILVLAGVGVPKNSNHKTGKPELNLFETILVDLGIAEAPPTPVYHGNPNTQVWLDLHTALYYCPGAELYGKTPGGRYEKQRDAQLDQFEPAFRKACD